jgi:molybdate transport repressor ModE-like protein
VSITHTGNGHPRMNPSDLDLRLLRSFVTVAQSGKISNAAKQLHLSQPAVTAHLRRLEEIIGKPLISRSTRGVKLTKYGHTLLHLATEVQNSVARIGASFHQELSGELRFGASLTIASHVIPHSSQSFAGFIPKSELN